MLRYCQYIFLVLLCLFCLSCKKYPENNLWFKNPKKISFMEGHLTHWIVNGVDSIDYLDNYFYNDNNNNPYTHKFSDLEFTSRCLAKGFYELSVDNPSDYSQINSIINSVEYEYKEKCKKIKFYKTATILSSFKKNIFISDDIVWEIIYLNRKNDKRKLKGNYNGNTYELQFN